ncbi:MAG: ribonuclease H-like YkuK family protein [Bacteroidota bacterium]
MKWRRLSGKPIKKNIKLAVEEALQKELADGHKMKVCIGSDSQVKGGTVEYATVIVFLREKKGGFMFISNDKEHREMSLRERMISEVGRSVGIAYELCDLLDRYDVGLEVHADINTDPHFQSNVALKEAMGYILGMGFVFKAKPNAFASTSCADKMV